MSSCQQHDWNIWVSTTQDATNPCPWCRIAELEVDKTALMERDEKYCNTIAAMRAENEAVEAENQRLRE